MSTKPVADAYSTAGTSPPDSHRDSLAAATPPQTAGPRKRGPVAKRRFQKGRFEIVNGVAYTLHYEDVANPDGSMTSRRARRTLGRIGVNGISQRSAFREHQAFMQAVNLKRQKVSRKTVVQVLVTISGIQKYAAKQGIRAVVVSLKDLEMGRVGAAARRPFFTKEQVAGIIGAAKEPYQTMFTLAWCTGLRAGEILALTVEDLNFARRTLTVNKSADDNNRKIGRTKTETSTGLLPMSSVLANVLQTYLKEVWQDNPRRLLFPNRRGTLPRRRDNVVKYGLHPVLRKLGIPTKDAGLHAFRHGLATELADKNTPISVLQKQMRHADVRTTLEVYAHVIPQSQRDAMEAVSIGTVPVMEQEQTASGTK
jgi:integrase